MHRQIVYKILMAQIHEDVFNVLLEKDEDGFYVGSVIELPGCHTQARTLDQLRSRIREAIEGYLAVASPKLNKPEFVGVQQIKLRNTSA
jgi:predicted RNase H-like HicB family nuclease